MSVSHTGTKSYPIIVASQRFYNYAEYRRRTGRDSWERNNPTKAIGRDQFCNKEYTIMPDFSPPEKPLSSYALGLLQFVKSSGRESRSFSIRSLLQAKPLESRDRLKAAIAELLKANAIREVMNHDKLEA